MVCQKDLSGAAPFQNNHTMVLWEPVGIVKYGYFHQCSPSGIGFTGRAAPPSMLRYNGYPGGPPQGPLFLGRDG